MTQIYKMKAEISYNDWIFSFQVSEMDTNEKYLKYN